ncbi:Mini-ribonuclease 3 [Proteiniclasticum sp. C24MP]|uniref:Mini-ribonuclease 3 n=1 Tax=Proteiniclasticum sp. C24MP TaxID=3374101 RepID=UPI00375465A5
MENIRPISENGARNYNPLSLAFIGDSVYENHVRERLILAYPNMLPKDLHIKAVSYVKASSQSRIICGIEESLHDDELYIYKRGRNTKSHTVPKNADLLDYRRASGFEALVGYLYLVGKDKRLEEIIDLSFKIVEEGENHGKERE